MKKIILLVLAAPFLGGCALNLGNMTVVSTKKYDITGSKLVKGTKVVGYDRYPVIIIPFGVPSFEKATADALDHDKCAVGLSDAVFTQLNYAFMVGMTGLKVEGNLIIDQSLPGCENHA